jgi:hypothetical protein
MEEGGNPPTSRNDSLVVVVAGVFKGGERKPTNESKDSLVVQVAANVEGGARKATNESK